MKVHLIAANGQTMVADEAKVGGFRGSILEPLTVGSPIDEDLTLGMANVLTELSYAIEVSYPDKIRELADFLRTSGGISTIQRAR